MDEKKKIETATLVDACRHGDREAMSRLYTLYAPKMLLLIQRYVSDPDDAQDILHDGFVLAFTRLDSLQNPDRLDYWLATIMRNLCIKFLQAPDMQAILDELPDSEDTKGMEEMPDFNAIVSLINTLPEGYQNVFRLAVLENKSHKEIASILGIAPNSSSSQLFRAKLQLRELITNYRKQIGLLSFLLLASSAGVLFILHSPDDKAKEGLAISTPPLSHRESAEKTENTYQKEIEEEKRESENSKSTIRPSSAIKQKISDKKDVSKEADSLEILPIKEFSDSIFIADNSSSDASMDGRKRNEEINMDEFIAVEDYPLPVPEHTEENNWTFSLSLTAGNAELASRNSDLDSNAGPGNSTEPNNPNDPSPGKPGQDVSFGGDDDGNGDEDKNDKDDAAQLNKGKVARREKSTAKPLKDQSHHNHQPISFSFTAQKRINPWLAVETGLSYTYLHTTFEDENRVTECHWHYLGIPLKVNFTPFRTGRFSFYGSVSGSFCLPVYSGASIDSGKAPLPGLSADGRFPSKPVWAVGVGIGVSFSLTDQISLYFEPTAQRYFTREVTVPNLWSDEPWGMTFPIGIRFNW